MKAKEKGIIRNVDSEGRVVLPVELRKTLHIERKTDLEFLTDGEKIVLQEYVPKIPACISCGNKFGLIEYGETLLCEACIKRFYQKLCKKLSGEAVNLYNPK